MLLLTLFIPSFNSLAQYLIMQCLPGTSIFLCRHFSGPILEKQTTRSFSKFLKQLLSQSLFSSWHTAVITQGMADRSVI